MKKSEVIKIIKETVGNNNLEKGYFRWPNGIKRKYSGDEIIELIKNISLDDLIVWLNDEQFSKNHDNIEVLKQIRDLQKKL